MWQTRLNNVINAFPISYSVNGKQYVAIAVGSGSSQSKALATLTPEIQNPDGGSVLWAVSYTHLDVYKRQGQELSPFRIGVGDFKLLGSLRAGC